MIPKRLYHFTSRYHINSVKKDGIALGCILHKAKNVHTFLEGYQWLTQNPDWNQKWDEGSSLDYYRTDFRITIRIAKNMVKRVTPWNPMSKILGLSEETVSILNSFGDPENWFIYTGTIKPKWFIKVDSYPWERAPNRFQIGG